MWKGGNENNKRIALNWEGVGKRRKAALFSGKPGKLGIHSSWMGFEELCPNSLVGF